MTQNLEGQIGPQLVASKAKSSPRARFVAEDLSRRFERLGDMEPLRDGFGGAKTSRRDIANLVLLGLAERLGAVERTLDLCDGYGKPVIVRRSNAVRAFVDDRRSA